MPEYGYHLSAEEHAPLDLVRNAKRAEEEGFGYALVSDHFHPWLDQQGHSGFVWSVIGGIAVSTERLELGTGVTCPLIRTHPAIIAHAAATAATMMPGRFFLGVGTGENLNEHVLGDLGRRRTSGWTCSRRRSSSCGRSGRAATRPSAATSTSRSRRGSTTCPMSRCA